MTTQTVEKTAAVDYFKHKLEFEIGPVELNGRLQKGERIQIIDLRTPDLYKESHVPTAVQANLEEIDSVLASFDKNTTTVVYCYNIACHLSAKAALNLAEKGYKVRELIGGWEQWAKLNLTAESSTKSSTKGTSCCGG